MNNTATKPQEYKPEVRGQYEDYPYPHRDPEKEGTFLAASDPCTLMALSHRGWGGMRDLRKGTRFLVAGCGTGDYVMQLAEELIGSDAEIIAIDLSSKSLEIAKARLAKRKLKNVTFHHMSILDAPTKGLGEFDVIESSGVLHHLPDPNAGLAALASLLKEDGLMNVMVYGQYGRLSIYLVQSLMKELVTEETPRAEKIAIAREYLNNVPLGHWLTVNNAIIQGDINWPDGSGIYDLFLHSTDRAYTVPQLYEWVEGAGLFIENFYSDTTDESLYLPESYTASPKLREIFAKKSLRERHAIAELMNGNIAKHSFYAAKTPREEAAFSDDMVICYGLMQHMFIGLINEFVTGLRSAQIGQRIQGKVRPFNAAQELVMTKAPHTEALLMRVDSARTIGEIVAEVVKESGAPEEEVRYCFELLYKELRSRELVYLRHKTIPPYATGPQILERVDKAIKS